MEQSNILQSQELKDAELLTDIDASAPNVKSVIDNRDAATVIVAEDTPSKPVSSIKNTNDNEKSISQGSTNIRDTTVLDKKIDEVNDKARSLTSKVGVQSYIPKDDPNEVYENIKDELIDSSYESQSLSTEEGQSLDAITESKATEDNVEISQVQSEFNTTDNAKQFNVRDNQCSMLHKLPSERSKDQVQNAHEIVKETIKEIHDNDSNQNSTIVTDAELTKLVHEDAEVVVLETMPVATNATTDNFIVTLNDKNVSKDCEETVVTSQEEKTTKSDRESNEFSLMDYSRESDGTITEVISTEVVDTPLTEQREQRDNKTENVKKTKSDTEPVTANDKNTTINKDITNEKIDRKTTNSKSSINVDRIRKEGINETVITDEQKIISKEDEDVEIRDLPQNKSFVIVDASENIDEMPEYKHKQEETLAYETSTADSPEKKRSVIQDIFDDWGVDNGDEDAQSTSKVHDSVEIELKSLLDETKSDRSKLITSTREEKIPSMDEESTTEDSSNVINVSKNNAAKELSEHVENQKKNKLANRDTTSLSQNEKDPFTLTVDKSLPSLEKHAFNTTPQSYVAIPKSRTRHLSSQIASSAEVTEVLKERLREKQKTIDAPRGADIFFVKKLTQRLSSKLAGGPVNSMPALIPLPQQSTSPPSQSTQSVTNNCNKKAAENIVESNKDGSTDNKELLAILEGDVDPDWSNLKPPILTEEEKTPINIEHSDHSVPPKLDPLVERELALKQLLELPVTLSKKNPSRKKKSVSAPNRKGAGDTDLVDRHVQSDTEQRNELCSSIHEQNSNKKNQDVEQIGQDTRVDESRSGRKRKPTEKAREHEQNTIKRQKVYKGKVSPSKRLSQENTVSEDYSSMENHVVTSDASPEDTNNGKNLAKEVINKEKLQNKTDSMLDETPKSSLKASKQNVTKKRSQAITKRKLVVRKLLQQNVTSNKKSVKLKTKLGTSSKKSKGISKSQKRLVDNISGDVKPKKKIINEIDRLLQDEGVVNLLYDVEQPDKKRLIPITKSRAKVMDLQKVQRELKLRKKLVRNAVLRLRTSSGSVSKVSPRSKRAAFHPNETQSEKKIGEHLTSLKSLHIASPTELMLPTKIRNAADASVIVRRHSSSSFSSASGSPRVSIDTPEKLSDVVKLDDGTLPSLRSTKRKYTQVEKSNAKKNKKKATAQKFDNDAVTTDTMTATTSAIATITSDNATVETVAYNAEGKVDVSTRTNKKAETRKIDKAVKQQETISTLENNVNSRKVTTRSNGAATGKVTAKNRKAAKSKVSFAKSNQPDIMKDSTKEEAELSACLAEAATALSIVSATRPANVTSTRKSKANATIAKVLDLDINKIKTETQNQFSNNEINVRRHGNLVQLILTPSSSTKIRNALTLQVMQEFKEALSILKRDDECRVVLLTSTGTSFCEGLELSTLLHSNKEERRVVAQELAHAVKDFIKSLATFNKPIVAGVQGAAVGLGVTMLPLFDLVIASDKATFCTPYGKLGQIAEGAAVFTLSHILGSAITSELLLGGRTLTASEALRAGLVTRVLWPDRFQVELLPSLKAMSDQSSQSMEATKALLRHSLRKKLDAALESETYLLIQHWCSMECQTAIKAYIDGKIQ